MNDKNILTGYLLVPTDYPNRYIWLNFRRSVIKLCSYKNPQENNQILTNGKTITLKLESTDIEGTTKLFSEDLKQLEIELNEIISQFFHKGE